MIKGSKKGCIRDACRKEENQKSPPKDKFMEKLVNSTKKKIRRNRILMAVLVPVFIGAIVFLSFQITKYNRENEELETKKAALEEKLEEQLERKDELENEKELIRTKQYIEEKARAIGYIYPDEIVFKEKE